MPEQTTQIHVSVPTGDYRKLRSILVGRGIYFKDWLAETITKTVEMELGDEREDSNDAG